MKKFFTLLALAVLGVTSSVWAEEAILSYNLGEGGNEATSANVITGATGSAAAGFTIAITGNTSKNWTNGNGSISYNGTSYRTLKNSNGAQNTLTCPDGYVATNITFYVTSNADAAGKLSEIDGTSCDEEVSSIKNYSSPTIISKDINNKSSFTFTFSTKQVCFIAIVTYKESKNAISESLKANSAVKLNDSPLTLDGDNDGYSVSGSTITLSNDITSIETPTNIKLVKTISYDDSSTKEEDVEVSFDGTITDGYYIGTASIGLTGAVTEYTVKVKKAVDPTAILSSTSGTISLTESWKTGSVNVTLTGANLTDGTYDVSSDVDGMTITPTSFTVASGSVEQEFTITSTASSAATTIFSFGTSAIGTTAPTYTVNFSQSAAKRSLSQTSISESTTWDWQNAGSATIQLDGATNPANGEEFLMASLPEITNDATFNSQALMVTCQFPNRGSNSYLQGSVVKFTTTVPGKLDITFSNTGGSRPYRYIRVNGTLTSFKSGDANWVNATNISVPAGDVIIDAYIPDATDPQERSGDVVGTTMVRIKKIVFTAGETVEIGPAGYATLYSASALTIPTGVKAYTGKVSGNSLVLSEVTTTIPAETAVVLEAEEGTYFFTKTTSASVITNNDLRGVLADTPVDANSVLVLGYEESEVGFYTFTGTTLAAGKAYLEMPANGAPAIYFSFEDETEVTGVYNLRVEEKANAAFDLSGRRANGKGLMIQNGKVVLVK